MSEMFADDASRVILGCFEVGGLSVAIDLAQLREVVRYRPATPLPGSPASIEGVIELRGALVPVVDLGRLLGGEPLRAGPRSRIAVAEAGGIALGLAVDAVVGILAAPGGALGDPPPLVAGSDGAATRAVVRRGAEPPIAVLCLEHVIESLRRDASAAGGGPR